ncbi:TVP38/TMEM64 family protein [Mesorhizobium xinjiangense]|uniref:TVP38/TMEM64 family protein n=1 Tax=Mesorhizobium xinjiangense TaxID=2678685 RepID=UPI0012ED0B63|nr:TVP38/TMEM64 family protein [Mesorhizobium xinjiangense]
MPNAGDNGARRWRRHARLLPVVILLAGLAFAYAMGWHHYFSLEYLAQRQTVLEAHVAENFWRALAAFFVLYVLAVAFSFPAASALTVFGGFLFGWLIAGVVVAIAATIGAAAVYLAARTALHDTLERRAAGRTARLARGLREDAFGYLLVLRLAPIFPFWLVNIAPALFGVPLRTYVAATFIGILPGTFAYAYLGEGVGSVLAAAKRSGRDVRLADLVTPEITIALLLLALVAAIPTIIKKIRAAAGKDG